MIVVHTFFNTSTRDAGEANLREVKASLVLHSEFQDSQGYTEKNKNKQTNKQSHTSTPKEQWQLSKEATARRARQSDS